MPAAMTFGGNESFSAPPEQVFAALTDLEQLPRIIPDLVSSEKVDDRTLNCVVRPGFSFLRGTLRMTITIVELTPPESASMKVSAAGIGAQIEVVSALEVAATDSGTAHSSGQPTSRNSRASWRRLAARSSRPRPIK